MKVQIALTQKVQYSFVANLTDEQYELIKDLDMDDVPMYIRRDGKIVTNPQYEVLEKFFDPYDVQNGEEEFLDVTIEEL
ncbi:hypothetical protein BFF93_15800 [Elizabethkingia meningoseptica]|uniref:hypothetical protein n=1 Tax=Elizabethkingia meningoseptica TaxID=238 RepID=UPI000842149C|nr:hypothetical protein [Elizabethkingia meningoseptica]ODM52197.1 hypothetical protein BES09_15575 [Elizabethkingia meningoseptica]OHT27002.1 hypothetical protein BFF93_15800 [Elizabethkingia meningoseptica]OPC10865.1 hypothetical protein BAX93_10575 [Elizabethkingia meningoseptica]